VNDLLFVSAEELNLREWTWESIFESAQGKALAATEEGAQKLAINSLKKTAIASYLDQIATGLATYDWRTSSTPGLSDTERLMKLAFRGSSGYRELRKQLLEHLASESGTVGNAAKKVLAFLGY